MNVIILLSVFGIVNLFLGFARRKEILLPLVLLVLLGVLGLTVFDWTRTVDALAVPFYVKGMFSFDHYATAFTAIMVVSTMLLLPFSGSYTRRADANLAEYYSLLLFALVGGVMLVGYENLLMLFLGVEVLSIPMYVLAGVEKRNQRSNEAALKYFLMGAFATGILLFGIALLYGATRTFNLSEIAAITQANGGGLPAPMLLLGLLLVMVGMAFKVGAAPFHFWTPDVYEGTPTFFTGFMSTVVKTAGFAAFYKLLHASFAGAYASWLPTVMGLTVLTLLIGNLGAVAQTSTKRMLAYSSISHAGYLLIALVAFSAERSPKALFFYSLSYSIATVAAFGVLKLVSDARDGREDYGALRGLGRTNPTLAVAMTVSMLSLAGIPLTGGFFGKFFLFTAAVEQGYFNLIMLAVLMSAVGIYYYFRPIISMYIADPDEDLERTPVPVTSTEKFTLWLLTALTILLGIAPGLVSALNLL